MAVAHLKILGPWKQCTNKFGDNDAIEMREVIKSPAMVSVYIYELQGGYGSNASFTNFSYSFPSIKKAKKEVDSFLRGEGWTLCETEDEEEIYRLLV